MIEILRYTPDCRARWNDFVASARNATFLHRRGYMDYHADRFADCSLMAVNAKGNIVAVLPADIRGTELRSHAGLTYGGWLTPARHFTPATMLEVWDAATAWMRAHGVSRFIYKTVPWIYAEYPADDDLYALFRAGAVVHTCQVSAAIPLARPLLFNQDARQWAKKAPEMGVTVRECHDLRPFWAMLEARLDERYDVRPVHTVEEMVLLQKRFPHEIRLFMAYDNADVPLGGILMYFTRRVAHSQYIATTSRGRELKVLPAIISRILDSECAGLDYFDFGVSCERGGLYLNEGLAAQKSGLGGRTVCYTSYRLDL